jgi:streptogramin lyase
MEFLRQAKSVNRRMRRVGARFSHSFFLCVTTTFLLCGCGNGNHANSHTSPPGVNVPGVRRAMSDIHPQATFSVEGRPDWMVVTEYAVWVTSSNVNHVVRLDPSTNRPDTIVTVAEPCSGLASGFGSIWVPSCGAHNLVRFDSLTGKIQAEIPASPADSEGGIAVGAGSVWMATDKKGVLARIDPQTNQIVATIAIPSGSYAPAFADGALWITSTEHNLLTRVDTQSNQVVVSIPVGPKPRFLTVGAGSVWTLNQGDGTISRVDTKMNKLVANIAVGIPGAGGEIAFGKDSVWATVIQIPISRIDPQTNSVAQQWFGKGGDSIRVGHGSIWLTDLMHSTVWRLDPDQANRKVPVWAFAAIICFVFVVFALLLFRRRYRRDR